MIRRSRFSTVTAWGCVGGYTLSLLCALASPSGDAKPQAAADGGAKDEARTAENAAGALARWPRPAVGFALNLHHNNDHGLYLGAVDDIAELGCNVLLIVAPAFQTHGSSTDIRLELGPGRGPRPDRLVALIDKAHQRGLAVALMPVVLLTDPRPGEWRGKINPENWDAWWRSYQRMTDYFLDIAVEANVELYCIGSELVSAEAQSQRWRTVIAAARRRYGGLLTYSANFDRAAGPTFWPQLDLIGVNGYFDLTGGEGDDAADDTLVREWSKHRDRLLALAMKMDRPLLMTEVGYPSLPTGLREPWNYVRGADRPATPDVQTRGYRAFVDAWRTPIREAHDAPGAPAAGVIFYEWDPYRRGGPADTGYGVRGKPARQIIQSWLDSW